MAIIWILEFIIFFFFFILCMVCVYFFSFNFFVSCAVYRLSIKERNYCFSLACISGDAENDFLEYALLTSGLNVMPTSIPHMTTTRCISSSKIYLAIYELTPNIKFAKGGWQLKLYQQIFQCERFPEGFFSHLKLHNNPGSVISRME